MVAPLQFLGRKTYQSAVIGYGRQCPTKSEAVGQENIGRKHAELVAIEVLTVHNISHKRLWRRDIRVGSVPRGAGNVPSALLHILLHHLILVWEVFLHPRIFHAALEVEHIVGILFEQHQVGVERLRYILAYRGLHIPVPLRIEVCVRHNIGFRLALSRCGERHQCACHKQYCTFFHIVFWLK